MIYEKQLHPRDTYQGIIFDEHEVSANLIANSLNTAPSAPPPQQQDDCVRVDKGLLLCVALTLRGALDCKDWHWSPDQWDAGDAWCTQLMTILAAAKEQK